MNKFSFLKAFNSPFIRPKIKFYIGKLQYGTPIFYPRKWVENKEKPGYLKAVPKKIGFDFVGLGWKTKWSETDYRYEWNPIWSFVFFKWQFCVLFIVPCESHYWESWLYYERNTNHKLPQKERIKLTKIGFPQNWIQYKEEKEIKIDYYNYILKNNL